MKLTKEDKEQLCVMTLAEVGKELGLHRSSVHLIENAALRKLRVALLSIDPDRRTWT